METIKDKITGLQFCVPIGSVLAKQLLDTGTPDCALIKWCQQYLSSTGTFVDIGCGVGAFSILLSRRVKAVHAFEPLTEYISCAAVSAALNNIYNIKFNNEALGAKEGDVKFYSAIPDIATLRPELAGKFNNEVLRETTVKVVTLDSIGLKDVDLICLYADGSELAVLQGAALTLMDSHFPPIVIKIRGDDWFQADKDLVTSHLKHLGYTVHTIGGCKDMYLASDHPLYKDQQKDKADKVTKQTDQLLKEIAIKYDAGKTEDFTWYEWYLLSRAARIASKNQLGYDCARKGLALNPPKDKEYLLWEEISIVTCYIDKKPEGYEATETVIFSKYAPFSTRNLACKNQSFYMAPLPFSKVFTVNHEVPVGYSASSSSIIAIKKGFKVNLRTVNYSINDNGSYNIRDPLGIVRTRNFMLDVDDSMNINSAVELVDNTGTRKYPQRIQGIEDLRLFAPGEFVCTCLEVNAKCIPQMCYGQCDEDGTIWRLVPLLLGNEIKCEKNWLPVYLEGKLHIVYTMSPFRLCAVDTATGVVTLIKEVDLTPDKNLDFFRGSATLIPYRGGWLATVHQVHHNNRRMYFHRFVWLNQDFTELKYSKVFYFESPNIEFNLSICHSQHGLLVPYSVADNCSKVGLLTYKDLDTLIL